MAIVISSMTACSAFDQRWECLKLVSAQRHKVTIFPENEIKEMIARQTDIDPKEVDQFCSRYY